ncbi:hypothetical protein Leryth_008950 [Lithospermum erythrorhizon]|nr:hypothetical protein Leryth_008950 [Lithospermum erythrorhizon]
MSININMTIGLFIFSAIFGLVFPSVNAQAFAPAPSPTSDVSLSGRSCNGVCPATLIHTAHYSLIGPHTGMRNDNLT